MLENNFNSIFYSNIFNHMKYLNIFLNIKNSFRNGYLQYEFSFSVWYCVFVFFWISISVKCRVLSENVVRCLPMIGLPKRSPFVVWYIVEAADIHHKPFPEQPPNRATIASISMLFHGDFLIIAQLVFLVPTDNGDGDENHGFFFEKMYLFDY